MPVFWPKMPPIGLGYLQSYLEKNNFPADILDLNNFFYNLAEPGLKKDWQVSCNTALENRIFDLLQKTFPKDFKKAMEKIASYDVAGFSCFKSNLNVTLGTVKFIKSLKKDIKIALGGPEITRQLFRGRGRIRKNIMESADLVAAGEGEIPLLDFIKGESHEKVRKFRQLDDLAHLVFPRYDGMNFSSYPGSDAIALQFSRGCIRKCDFCSEKLLYKGFRTREVKSLMDEIKYHKGKNSIKHFIFFDSMINADLKKFEDLCDNIIKNFGSINWEAQMAVRKDMSMRLLEKVKKSGCYNLFVGLESGCDKTLERMNKGFSSGEAEVFFKKLKKAGLSFGISIIVGYPGETETDFKESLDFVIRNKDIIPKIEQVNPFVYYDGTAADRNGDYKTNKASVERMKSFVREIKKQGFKYTNAFLGNLIETAYRP
jgi:radical SAM superfamily enzyme YgiQ (UPF0313 family)